MLKAEFKGFQLHVLVFGIQPFRRKVVTAEAKFIREHADYR
jgi:hypothetical protein